MGSIKDFQISFLLPFGLYCMLLWSLGSKCCGLNLKLACSEAEDDGIFGVIPRINLSFIIIELLRGVLFSFGRKEWGAMQDSEQPVGKSSISRPHVGGLFHNQMYSHFGNLIEIEKEK
ncbi:hypothetical protein Godav_013611 [Gossypium davidsonii]|uniref:Uncharacterized protein n=2 Tax=Gossypium TaxID=3633 RepID=A0A7J8RIE2_GOSDV|nr:hypothetical protein [Gossypium davidsonii]MBA0648305.1 hypothetical protein [Gossypium klotzschianum]